MSKYIKRQEAVLKTVKKVTLIALGVNLIIGALKVVFGVVFANLAMLSDAAHSSADIVSTLIMLLAVSLSGPKSDKKHNYGHEKIEALFVLLFSFLLLGLAGVLVWQAVLGILTPVQTEVNWLLIGVAVFSILAKEGLFHFMNRFAQKTKSAALKADAWHSRTDALSSVAILIGLVLGIFWGNNLFESIAVLVISALILKVAVFDIALPSINQLVDKAASEKTCDKISALALSVSGVLNVDKLKTRVFGSAVYVDLEICVCGSLSVTQGHVVAEAVHDALENSGDLNIKHCSVHVNPPGAVVEEA